jgi:FkbM family methyltransferase
MQSNETGEPNDASIDTRRMEYVEIPLSNGRTRRFFLRKNNTTDKSVVQQIFDAQHYDLAPFPLTPSLENYANQQAAGGASLLVIDAGANIGASALYFTQRDPRIHVCAVEPEPGNFSVLQTNCMGLPVTTIEAAVASVSGRLWLSDPGIGDWGFRAGSDAGVQVEAISMYDILGRYDARFFIPLICKFDIEGGEADLFSANDAWIDQFPLIIIELHDWLLPGTSNSRNFLNAIGKRNFDVIYRGENMFCFNNDSLSQFPPTTT